MVSFVFDDAKFKSIIEPFELLSTFMYKPRKNSLKFGSLVRTWFPSFSKKFVSQKLSFGLLSLGVSNVFNWMGEDSVMLNMTVDNLLDEEYISTIGYPEPGRSIKFTLEYKL